MTELILTPKERQALKGQAHRLNPVVLMGAGGLTDAVVREVDRALTAHELIKVRVPGDDRDERDAIFTDLAQRLSAARVQSIGKLLVLYRPKPPEPPEPHKPAATPAPTGRTADKRSPKAPARKPGGTDTRSSKTASRTSAGHPGRADIRKSGPRTSAPRRGTGRSR